MSKFVSNTLNQLKVLILLSIAVLITHYAAIGDKLNWHNAVIGMAIIAAIAVIKNRRFFIFSFVFVIIRLYRI